MKKFYSFFRLQEIFTDHGDLGSDMVTLLMKQDIMSENKTVLTILDRAGHSCCNRAEFRQPLFNMLTAVLAIDFYNLLKFFF